MGEKVRKLLTIEQDEILKRFVQPCLINDLGHLKLHDQGAAEYQTYKHVLISELLEDNTIVQKMNRARYNFFDDSFPDKHVRLFLKKMKEESSYSFNELKNHLLGRLNTILSEIEISTFNLYFLLNITIDEQIRDIKFKDATISFLKYEDFKVYLDEQKLNRFFEEKKPRKERYTYVKATIRARNVKYALDVSTEYVSLFMAFISYSLNYRREIVSLLGQPKALTYLKLSHIFAFKEETYLDYYFFNNNEKETQFYELKDTDISNLNILLGEFNLRKAEVQNIIQKALSLYHKGLIESDLNYSFLSFWTVFEILTLKNKGIKHLEVKNRIKATLTLGILDDYYLERLYSLRNNLIHNGTYSNVSQTDRNRIKTYSETALSFFVFTLSKYSISDIELIYRYLGKDKKSLEKHKETIDLIMNLKGYHD